MPFRAARAGWLSAVPRPPDEAEQHKSLVEPDAPSSPKADQVPGGTRLARAILVTVLCGFLTIQVIDVANSPIPLHGGVLAVGLASIALVFVLQIANSDPRAVGWPMRRRAMMLLAQGLVTYLPLLVLAREWGGMAGFLAGSALLLVRGWAAWSLFAAISASMLAVPLLMGVSPHDTVYLLVSTVDIGLIVFGLSRLSLVIQYLHATRGKLAQLAIANERMRFARDLHDLLGYSLSAITLKVELTRRLMTGNPGRARDEIAEVLDIARQALADVRLVASGYRNISLAKEASAVGSLLSAAGIDARLEITCGPLEEQVDTVLATVLREAVTNTLRHSAARNCWIEAGEADGTVRLKVINDGLSHKPVQGEHRGGLSNLTARLEAIGGQMTAGIRANRWFELVAEAPIHPPKARTRHAAIAGT